LNEVVSLIGLHHNHEFEIKTVHGTGYQLLTPVYVMGL